MFNMFNTTLERLSCMNQQLFRFYTMYQCPID